MRRAVIERPPITRSASGTGPDRTPPSRVTSPDHPCLIGSSAGSSSGLERDPDGCLDGGRADAEHVQRPIAMSPQFEDRHRRAETRGAEVDREE